MLGLVDYLLHKAPYWSVNNFEHYVDQSVRDSFLKYVESAHHDNQNEFAGMSCVFQQPQLEYALTRMLVHAVQIYGHMLRPQVHPR